MGSCLSNPKPAKTPRSANPVAPNTAGPASEFQDISSSTGPQTTSGGYSSATPKGASSKPPKAKQPVKSRAISGSGPRHDTPSNPSEPRNRKSANTRERGKEGPPSQTTKHLTSEKSAPASSEQLDYTGKVTTKNPPDTSYKLLNSYAGEVKGVKGLKSVTVRVLRMVGNGPNDPNFKRWTAAVDQGIRKDILLWKKIRGPFIHYIGFATIDGLPAVLTEFEEGTTAKEYLAKKPMTDKRRLILEFSDAIRLLHKEQLAHGNLEPRHFMVDKKGKAKLGGFCFNQMIEEELKKVNPSEEYRRSSRYTPPEVLENRPTSEKSDVYSFACVAGELITGKMPFAAIPQEAAVTQLVINGEPHLTKEYAELQNDPWWATLRSCWSKSPEARPSMETVYEKLLGASKK